MPCLVCQSCSITADILCRVSVQGRDFKRAFDSLRHFGILLLNMRCRNQSPFFFFFSFYFRPRSEIKAKEEEKWALVATPHIKKQYTEMAEAVKSALEIAALHRYST